MSSISSHYERVFVDNCTKLHSSNNKIIFLVSISNTALIKNLFDPFLAMTCKPQRVKLIQFLDEYLHCLDKYENTPGPWLLRISVVRFHLCAFTKNSPNIQLMGFSLHKWKNSFTHAFLDTNVLSSADLVHADFCQT